METFKKYTLSILVIFVSPIIGLFVYAYGGGAFNLHILYKSHKELKRSRAELKRLKETMLAELEENYKKAKVGLKDEN